MDPTVDQDANKLIGVLPEGSMFENVVITGSSGMLGLYHVELLAEISRKLSNKIKIHAFSRSPSPYLITLAEYYPESIHIENYETSFSAVNSDCKTHVIHAASPASPESYVGNLESLISTNVLMSHDLVNIFSQADNHLTLLSSGEVYGPVPDVPTSETSFDGFDHLGPRGAYPELKRVAELIFLGESEFKASSSTALRIFHTFGPGINLDQTRIFSTVLKCLIDSRPIQLHSDGSAKRSFLYAADLVHATMRLANSGITGAFNVGSGEELSMIEFSKLASRLVPGTNVETLTPSKNVVPQASAARGLANTDRLQEQGWQPLFTTEAALERTLTSLKWRSARGLL
jgi:UDP-glucuronate decarboxylase